MSARTIQTGKTTSSTAASASAAHTRIVERGFARATVRAGLGGSANSHEKRRKSERSLTGGRSPFSRRRLGRREGGRRGGAAGIGEDIRAAVRAGTAAVERQMEKRGLLNSCKHCKTTAQLLGVCSGHSCKQR